MKISLQDFADVTGVVLNKTMTFAQVVDELDENDVRYFYVSMSFDDVLEAIENESEKAKALDIRLIEIEPIGVFIALY